MKKITNIKLLKNLPLIGLLLIIVLISFGNILFKDSSQVNLLWMKVMNYGFFTAFVLIIIPNLILFVLMSLNKPFREDILTSEIKADERDEREKALSAYAGKKAFAAMHFSLISILVLFLPFQFVTTMFGTELLNFFGSLGIPGYGFEVFYFLIPLIVGNYTYHHALNSKLISKPVLDFKEARQEKKSISIPFILLALVFGILLGYMTPKQNYAVTDPAEIMNLNTNYRDYLKTMPEKDAQERLIKELNNSPSVIKAKLGDNLEYPGIFIDYCSSAGTKAALGNSWENMKNY